MQIIYVHGDDDKEVIGNIITNRSLTVEEALEMIGVNMDNYAVERGWEGYDPLAIRLEY